MERKPREWQRPFDTATLPNQQLGSQDSMRSGEKKKQPKHKKTSCFEIMSVSGKKKRLVRENIIELVWQVMAFPKTSCICFMLMKIYSEVNMQLKLI